MEKKRRLRNGKITCISLCRRGRNKVRTLLKSDGRFGVALLTKADKDLLHALVYVPEENGAIDTDGDVMTAAEIQKMAHDFLAESDGGKIDIEHDLRPLSSDEVRIAETFIVQKGDSRFDWATDYDGNPVDPTGSWGIILKILDPDLRADFESGALDGVSLFGHAEFEPVTKSQPSPTPSPMDQKDIDALATAIVTALKKAESVAEPAAPAPAAAEPQMPEFSGDPTNPADLDAYETECLKASLDLSKPADMKKWREHLAKRETEKSVSKSQGDGNETELEKAQREAREANERVAKLEKSSSQPAKPGEGDAAEVHQTGLSKADNDNIALGKSLGARLNKAAGRV